MKLFLSLLLFASTVYAQVTVKTSDELTFAAKVAGNKILIAASFQIKNRIEVADNVTIDGQGKTISSKLFFTEFRHFESFSIRGKNVTFKNLNLQGDDGDVRNIDTMLYQTAVRVYADSFSLINCKLDSWGWAGVYGYRIGGLLIDGCSFSRIRNDSYGYACYFEGLPGEKATVRNSTFSDCIAFDGGGQRNFWDISNCTFEIPLTSHRNDSLTGPSVSVTGCTFYSSCKFPAPGDGGYLTINANRFTGDSSVVTLKSSNPKATISITGNTFNWRPPAFFTLWLKSSARFTPRPGVYQAQILIDDTIRYKTDVTNIWKWSRASIPVDFGNRKVSVRLVALRETTYSCTLYLDSANVKDGDFENGQGNWRQSFNNVSGSGITEEEKYSGRKSWRFEYRGASKGSTATLSKVATF